MKVARDAETLGLLFMAMARYREALAGVGDLEMMAERAYGEPVYHLLVVRSRLRDRRRTNYSAATA